MNEDISEKDFLRIIGRYHSNSNYTTRSKRILEENRDIANKQIYQYYLQWNGEYLDGWKKKTEKTKQYSLFLLTEGGRWGVEVIDDDTRKLVHSISSISIRLQQDLQPYYKFKHNGVILFKKSEDYDDFWEETRFLEHQTDTGLALISSSSRLCYPESDVVKRFPGYVLVKISYNKWNLDLYAQERPYSIKGGLKISMGTYLLGAPPYIEMRGYVHIWVDGQLVEHDGKMCTLNLGVGRHSVKIKGFKNTIINMVKISPLIKPWGNHYKWRINKGKENEWKPTDVNGRVVGLKFEELSHKMRTMTPTPLESWSSRIFYLQM